MTITLNLTPEIERTLHERAAANGQTVEVFLRELVEREIAQSGGAHPAPPPRPSKTLDEVLEPVHREFKESGMAEDELVRFLTEVRDEVRQKLLEAVRGGPATPLTPADWDGIRHEVRRRHDAR
jgi:hypothetical protein